MPASTLRLLLVLPLVLGIPLLLMEAGAPAQNPALAAIALVPNAAPTAPMKGYGGLKVEADTVRPAADTRAFRIERSLIMPVLGVSPSDLRDTFTARRSGGRTHHAIDIMAPHGTPIVAASDGVIVRRHVNRLGGNTLYQLTPDSLHFLYYAHLDHYAPGMVPGRRVLQGEVLGFVGSTGNASPSAPHLHFAVWRTDNARNVRPGRALNPFRLLRDGSATDGVRG